VADGKVYVGTRRGDIWVLAAGRDKKVISSIELDSSTTSTPVAANGVLYITTLKKLYALKNSAQSRAWNFQFRQTDGGQVSICDLSAAGGFTIGIQQSAH
jgi:outer membrane protein assembly factor BamB